MKKLIFIVLFACLPSITYAECALGNVYEDIACYEKALKANKTKLNQTYQKLFNAMDEDGKKILESSQKNWLLYKNSHCDELVSYVSSGALGAGSKLINLSCNAELVEQRIQQLKNLNE